MEVASSLYAHSTTHRQRVVRYTIIQTLGKGHYGTVRHFQPHLLNYAAIYIVVLRMIGTYYNYVKTSSARFCLDFKQTPALD